jgi:predicted DNA-binding protein (UPF0251 family)
MARPRLEITDEQIRQAQLLSGYGLTQNQVADVLGISRSTFEKKKNEERVQVALQKGRAIAQQNVGKSIYEKALNGDMTAAIWWEKTRAGRTEKAPEGSAANVSVQVNVDGKRKEKEQEFEKLFAAIDEYRADADEVNSGEDQGQLMDSQLSNA